MAKGMFPFQWVPGEKWAKEHGQLFTLEMSEKIGLHISIDPRWHLNSGVLREVIDPAVMHIRHGFKETLDENGKLVESPTVIHDMLSVKKHFWHWKEHMRRFEEENPDKQVVAFSSNGNCGSNPYYVASDGKNILHLNSEAARMQGGRTYSLVSTGMSLDLFGDVEISHEQALSSDMDFKYFGQLATGIPLVITGEPLDKNGLISLVREGKIYDLGHMFRFGYIKYKESWVNLGYNGFFTDGKLDYDKVAAGVNQEVVEDINIGVFAEDEARKSMEAKGYVFVARPKNGRTGEFTIKDGKMDVVFLPGIYPHSMFGLTKDGRMISAAIRALGNRAGGTDYLGAAEIMAELRCEEAILCDNGGDTVNGFASGEFFTQTEEPNRGLRSVFLYYVERDEVLRPDDLRAIMYPPQYPS